MLYPASCWDQPKTGSAKFNRLLEITLDKAWGTGQTRKLVTTEVLGRAKIPDLPYERADGKPFRLDTDYLGVKRNAANPFPGPFELPQGGQQTILVWPAKAPQIE